MMFGGADSGDNNGDLQFFCKDAPLKDGSRTGEQLQFEVRDPWSV